MKRWCVALAGLLLAGSAWAGGAKPQVEASMLVTGSIEVAPDGSVSGYAIDHPDQLPPVAAKLLGQSIPAWRFAPVRVDGQPAEARARMGIRLVARPVDGGNYSVGVASAWFSPADSAAPVAAATVTYKSQQRPRYPRMAAQDRVAGTAYVAMKVGRDGKVADAAVEQVDLYVLGNRAQMAEWRGEFADAALAALRQDTFTIPAIGPRAHAPYWIVHVPVTFNLNGMRVAANTRRPLYGHWRSYVPGPVTRPDWEHPDLLAGADAVPEGAGLLADSQLHLLATGNGG